MKSQPSIAYYITAHGYGHGVRSCDIIRALRRAAPEVVIQVISDLPVDFLRSRLDLPLDAYRAGSFDVGMVQLDSIRVDVDQTLHRVNTVLDHRNERIVAERALLRAHKVGLVVSDIPAIPLEAARAERIPSIAVGNFTWNWIYEEFIDRDVRWRHAVDAFREGYAAADLLLRLPFSEPMDAFPRQEHIPLVATPGTSRRDELARVYGIDPGKTWVLLSFTTLEWDASVVAGLARYPDHVFLTVLPLGWSGGNFFGIDRHRFSFSDVIASADVVVSKPGYGILSECAVNEKTLIYAERTEFREYPVLEAALKNVLRNVHIPAVELYSGNLRPYLEAARIAPAPVETINAGGDVIAAQRMLDVYRNQSAT
jgi:L-arabinokinase